LIRRRNPRAGSTIHGFVFDDDEFFANYPADVLTHIGGIRSPRRMGM
jgi:hypothetical protein